MTTIYFSNGETAEVDNVRGRDPRTFSIPQQSYHIIANAWQTNATAKFSETGPDYLLISLQGMEATLHLQITRR